MGKYKHHFVATTSGTIYDVKTRKTYRKDVFMELLPQLISEGTAIDEFHRIGEPLYSALQGMSGNGKILLITSAYHILEKILGKKQPTHRAIHCQKAIIAPSA